MTVSPPAPPLAGGPRGSSGPPAGRTADLAAARELAPEPEPASSPAAARAAANFFEKKIKKIRKKQLTTPSTECIVYPWLARANRILDAKVSES